MKLPRQVRQVIFVGGTSGSGKTTLVRLLADQGAIYEERGEDNPFIMEYISTGQIQAEDNQNWFLDRIEEFLETVDKEVAIVDQHPFAIGLAYTELFREMGYISLDASTRLAKRASAVYTALSGKGVDTLTVHLSASSSTLWNRLMARSSPPKLPREAIFRVNELLQKTVFAVPCLPINSEVLSPAQEREAVLDWLSRIRSRT